MMKKRKDWRKLLMLSNNIHATLIAYKGKGILFSGKSGSGKSDLALRFILEHGAELVADDRVDVFTVDYCLFGSSPKEIAGKLEVRGVGIASFPFIEKSPISLFVELVDDIKQIDRLPEYQETELLDIRIPKLTLFPFESSAICKIIAKISGIIS